MNPKSWLDFFCVFIMVIVAVGVYRRRTGRESNKVFFALALAQALLLLFDGFHWCLRDTTSSSITVTLLFILIYTQCLVVLGLFHIYLRTFLKEHYGIGVSSFLKYASLVILLLCEVLWLSSFFTGLYFKIYPDGSFEYTKYHQFSQVGVLFILLPDFFVLLQERKKIGAKNIIFWIGLPLSAVVVRYFDLKYDLPFVYPAMTILMLSIFTMVNSEMDNSLDRMTMEVRETMGKVMVSQIQPHFLYNVLNSISILCRMKPEKAAVVTDKFASYLRWNISSVFSSEPVSVTEEIDHTKTYLELEKERFGDILTVVWNVEDENFYLPPLVLQPLVENAVRHGVCQKEDGGTVWIDIYSDSEGHNVVISDDGVGFDANGVSSSELHVGLEYAKRQIEGICKGTMNVESTPGKGTRVRITLPKDNNSAF